MVRWVFGLAQPIEKMHCRKLAAQGIGLVGFERFERQAVWTAVDAEDAHNGFEGGLAAVGQQQPDHVGGKEVVLMTPNPLFWSDRIHDLWNYTPPPAIRSTTMPKPCERSRPTM